MQEDLRRSNHTGNPDGLRYLCEIILLNTRTTTDAVRTQCIYEKGISIDVTASIALFEYLDLIVLNGSNVTVKQDGTKWYENITDFNKNFCELVLEKMISNQDINLDAVIYDPENDCINILRTGFPLYTAALRNLLIAFGFMHIANAAHYQVDSSHYEMFRIKAVKVRKKLSLAALQAKMESQNEQGKLAEEFVVAFEKMRMAEHPFRASIKIISDFDVTAGYDIVSYMSLTSKKLDRFIEVKSFSNREHFYWSINEINNAQILGENYYLYLVDMQKINETDYQPEMICNPYQEIFEGVCWITNAEKYKVYRIESII